MSDKLNWIFGAFTGASGHGLHQNGNDGLIEVSASGKLKKLFSVRTRLNDVGHDDERIFFL